MRPDVHRQLSAVDWDFVQGHEGSLSGLHWYPGSFVPGLPGALIEALSSRNGWVLDPYGGAGTTGMAALVRGRRAICCDFNPIATLSAYVGMCLLAMRIEKLTVFQAAFRAVEDLVTAISGDQSPLLLSRDQSVTDCDRFVSLIASPQPKDVLDRTLFGPPNQEALARWYEPATLNQLTQLMSAIADGVGGSEFARLLALTMASAVTRQLSSQTRSWGHVADNVYPKELIEKDVARAGLNWLRRVYNRFTKMDQRLKIPDKRPSFASYSVDWSKQNSSLAAGKMAQLLITSPPYAGAIDYILAQRLSLYVFGYSDRGISELCGNEIGARRKRFVVSHISSWASDLTVALKSQLKFVDPHGHVAFILPHKDHGRDSGADALRSAMREHGWALGFERDRSIRQVKARQSWTSIKRETILVFERSEEN